jgi:hypothetical protein
MTFVTQAMRCELGFERFRSHVGFLVLVLFLKGHEQRLVPLAHPFHKRFRNRSQNLRRDLTVPYFCFPPFECLSTGNSPDGFDDPISCRFTCHSFFNLRLCFSRFSRPGTSLLRSESVIFLVDSLYTETIESVKSRAALSDSSPEVIWIVCEINSKARL